MRGELTVKVHCPHRWDLTPSEAMAIQRELAQQLITEDVVGDLINTARCVAGVDVHQSGSDKMRAVVCILQLPQLTEVEYAFAEVPASFPYIPGLLAFREGPAVIAAFERIDTMPDFILWDAQGLAHQRHLGLASHMGILLDIPSIGCAKSVLYGEHEEPPDEVGAWAPMRDPRDGSVIGAALRTRKGVQPIYVSIGHKVSLETAIELVLRCCTGYRIPEPLRCAHRRARQKDQEPSTGTQPTLF